ncbi:MAG: hypothetical protein JW894_10745 [Bacteroidales bacterium]|nr:hypothetical protein [Bacteroidales bacterium]
MIRFKTKLLLCSLYFIFILSYTGIVIHAQERHDISIQYGLVTTPEIFDALAPEITTDAEASIYEKTNKQWLGGFYVNYKYFYIPSMSVGLTFGYDRVWCNLEYGREKQGECSRDFYTISAEWTVHYIRKDYFQMYSGGGLAATFVYEDYSVYDGNQEISSKSKVYPNFNFTFTGLRFGPQCAFFLETGFGYKGIICGGISTQF